MPQLSLYLNDATMETLRSAARSEGISMSQYASRLIQERAASPLWPHGYWETIYGCLGDDDLAIDGEGLDSRLDDDCDWF